MDEISIRDALLEDADVICLVMRQSLLQVTAKHYGPGIIQGIANSITREGIAANISSRRVFVACSGKQVVGTASFDGRRVRAVFVAPDRHGSGIGRLLMERVEDLARKQGITQLEVPASINANGFYEKLGYVQIDEEYLGQARMLVMQKTLSLHPMSES